MEGEPSSLVFLQYLTTVFDNIGEAILLIGVEPNETYRLLLANAAFAAGSGHNSKEAMGKRVDETVSKASYAKLKKQYKLVVTTKQPISYTEWYNVPLGKQAYEIKLIPILNAVGECVQIAAITKNVTETVHLREQVKKLQKLR